MVIGEAKGAAESTTLSHRCDVLSGKSLVRWCRSDWSIKLELKCAMPLSAYVAVGAGTSVSLPSLTSSLSIIHTGFVSNQSASIKWIE